MWTDDLESVESCGFCRSLINFDSIDSIGAHDDTDTFVYVKTPSIVRPIKGERRENVRPYGSYTSDSAYQDLVYFWALIVDKVL